MVEEEGAYQIGSQALLYTGRVDGIWSFADFQNPIRPDAPLMRYESHVGLRHTASSYARYARGAA
jgi:hypothetical protein